MGMFDYLTCEYPLPDNFSPNVSAIEPDEAAFQTKSFDRCLEKYTLTKNGRLFLDGKDQNYEGEFQFHTLDDNDIWHEYRVLFENGNLKSIRVAAPDERWSASKVVEN